MDRNRNNVVLSRRAFLEESQSEGRKKLLESLQKGERRRGTVSSIVNFGAFVDLGGVDGLVHVSELSWKHVDHPNEVVTVGEEVDVEVLDVDLDRERVSLSLRATQEDPWKEFERMYQAGEVVDGAVTKIVPFGAFVRVSQGIEGLVHISELSEEHVESPEQVVNVGDEVRVKVVDVDVQRRRISLSMKQVGGQPLRAPSDEIEAEVVVEAMPEVAPVPDVVPDKSEVREPEPPPLDVPEEEAAAPPTEPVVEAPEEQSEEDISLEAIVEELKRREGRSD
jgi:small subunit ribosomal protein S1